MNKIGIFFDLDGTLWDAIEPIKDSYNQTMIKKSLPYKFDYKKVKSCMGLTPEETGSLFFPELPIEDGINLFKEMVKDEIIYLKDHPGVLYPNEKEVLSKLSSKYPLYIVSNADKGYIENYLNTCGTDIFFKDHVSAGDTSYPKWKNILYMKNKENIQNVIYVGDTYKDYIEATKAEATFIHASYGFGVIDDDVIYIKSLTDLDKTIKKIIKS